MWESLILWSKVLLSQVLVMPISFIFTGMIYNSWLEKLLGKRVWSWVHIATLLILFLLLDAIGTILFLAASTQSIIVLN